MPRLALIALLSLTLGCDLATVSSLPSTIGDEEFEVTRRIGTDLADDEFKAFYSQTAEALRRGREDFVVETGIGTAGTIITAVTVAGADGMDILGTFLPGALPEFTFVDGTVSGRKVVRAKDSQGIQRHVVAFATEQSIYVVDAQSEGALTRALSALPPS